MFVYSFNKYLLSTYTILATDILSALMELKI